MSHNLILLLQPRLCLYGPRIGNTEHLTAACQLHLDISLRFALLSSNGLICYIMTQSTRTCIELSLARVMHVAVSIYMNLMLASGTRMDICETPSYRYGRYYGRRKSALSSMGGLRRGIYTTQVTER